MTEVPVIELAGMSEAQKRAYIIADNKLALNAGWDTEMLAIEFGDLAGLGFDLSLTGFGDGELASIMNTGNPGLTDPDDVPEVPKEPVSGRAMSGCSASIGWSAAIAQTARTLRER